ncbi:MAG TPA: signal peptidase I [Anaerolineae bacterium]|nr:signal peptidase I [Anaerolineae bacterium]
MNDFHRQPEYDPLLEEMPAKEDRWANVKSILREVVETAILTLVIFLMVRMAFQNFRIEGHSMETNLHNGQFLIVNKLVYYLHPPQRGDVVVFHSPQSPRKDFIKRVVGLPGEEVEMVDGEVYVEGIPVHEAYIANPGNRSWGPEVVGEFEYFVLGDNRSNSSDSRSWGMLDGDAIIGKAWVSYWPPGTLGPVPHYTFAAVE